METKKRKILIPIFNRAHFGRLRSVLKAVKEHSNLELQIITSCPLAYDSFFMSLKHGEPNSWKEAIKWYLRARYLSFIDNFKPGTIEKHDYLMNKIRKEGYKIDARVPMFIDGGSSTSMAKSVGIGLIKVVDVLEKLKPDIIFINADRFEMMSLALASAYLNIPIAHNEGGDVSGTIDESVRHSITKLSHIHFTSTKESKRRVLQMGENPENVFFVGSPAIDIVSKLDLNKNPNIFPNLEIDKPYLFVLFHPVTTENQEENIKLAKNIIGIIKELKMPTIFLGSNVDAKSKEVGLQFKELQNKKYSYIHIAKNLAPDDFYRYLAKSKCALGNSSSFIREAAYFGTPAVLVGTRQNNREKGKNIIESGNNYDEVLEVIKKQLQCGRYEVDLRFGKGNAGKKIADILSKIKVDIQKKFFDIK